MVVNTEAERGPAYRKMLESVLANRQFVGAHWFQYLDQPVTGRWLDGENGHLGLVGITDVPWHDFVLSVARRTGMCWGSCGGRRRPSRRRASPLTEQDGECLSEDDFDGGRPVTGYPPRLMLSASLPEIACGGTRSR